jgi:hypothetical protein
MDDVATRAKSVFAQARARIGDDCDQMHATHAAKGLLGSGATVKLAVRAFHARSSEALKQLLEEIAKRVEHRGRAWAKAMSAVSLGLDEQIALAPEILAKSFKLARVSGTATEQATAGLISKAGQDLHAQLAEFRDGWTAPKAKRWQERHPVFYALFLLVAGSIIGATIAHFAPAAK